MKPSVTIGVCVRNSSSTLRDTIESIANQDFPHELMEVIFVDDGSEDNTLFIIREYVSRMNIAAKIYHTDWQGLGPARNVIVNKAQGKYIIWVDGDMTLPKNHVHKQIEFIEQNPNVGIANAEYGIICEEKMIAALESIPFLLHYPKGEEPNKKMPGTGGSIYRTEALKQVGGFDNNLRGPGEDQDVAHRINSIGWNIAKSPAVFYEKRPRTLRKVWAKHIWYGYGNYSLFRKNRNIFSFYKMNPIVGFFTGAIYGAVAYKMLHRKFVLLFPFYYAFKMSVWALGFVKAQLGFSESAPYYSK